MQRRDFPSRATLPPCLGFTGAWSPTVGRVLGCPGEALMLPWRCFCEVALWHNHGKLWDVGAASHGTALQRASVKPGTTQPHSHLLRSSGQEHMPSHLQKG